MRMRIRFTLLVLLVLLSTASHDSLTRAGRDDGRLQSEGNSAGNGRGRPSVRSDLVSVR